MNPEIKGYLDEHGATYTRDALRMGLLDAGHDPALVDEALRDWEAARTSGDRVAGGRTFGRWAGWFHLGALAATFVLIVALKGFDSAGIALGGVGVLAVVMIIGWLISSLIGRALLPRTGLTFALVAPAISAVALGGTCFALLNTTITAPPRNGTVELEILAPLAFEGSGGADCYMQTGGGVQINSHDLGTLDGKSVVAFVYWYGTGAAGPAGNADLSISLNPTSASESVSYTAAATGRLTVDASADGRAGTMQFEDLSPELVERPLPSGSPDLEPISGSLRWTCE